jgi:hypothetical protein
MLAPSICQFSSRLGVDVIHPADGLLAFMYTSYALIARKIHAGAERWEVFQ